MSVPSFFAITRNFRASPFGPILPGVDNFSRAVEYSIDETTMDVTQLWEYGQFIEKRLFPPYLGDADYVPITGNVLITFEAVTTPRLHAKIIEVTHTTPVEKVFGLSLPSGLIYRSERLPSLYP